MEIADLKKQVDQYLQKHLGSDCDQSTLYESMYYSVMAGGKRLRPTLTLAVVHALGKDLDDDVMRAASAVELLHTYSLIHDDLPAMDNDDLRRFLPTNHRRFGAGMATLAGDGLLTLAFQWVSDNHLKETVRLQLVQLLAQAAGPAGMVAGQAMDIHYEGNRLSLNELKNLHAKKTGSLLRYSVMAGGVIAQAPADTLRVLASFGAHYGLAFQIYDDLMDVVSSEAKMGKAVNKDADEQKNTYPNLLGIDGTKQALAQAIAGAKADKQQLDNRGVGDFSLLDDFLAYFRY